MILRRFFHLSSKRKHFNENFMISNKIIVPNLQNIDKKKIIEISSRNYYEYSGKYSSSVLNFYPISIEEYNFCCDKLLEIGIDFTKDCVNPDQDILTQHFYTNLEIPDFECIHMKLSNIKMYVNLPMDVKNMYIFKNCPPLGNFSHSKFYPYELEKTLKLSPNVLRIRNLKGLDESIIKKTLEIYNINQILPPFSEIGFWSVFIGNKESYYGLINNIFKYKNQNLIINPLYIASNTYPIGKKSKNIIEIYSAAKEFLLINKLKSFLNYSNCNFSQKFTNKGIVYTINFNDLTAYENLIYKNGLPINGTSDYFMSFGDENRIEVASTPQIFINFPKDCKVEIKFFLKEYDYEFSNNPYCIFVNPRSLTEWKYLLKKEIKINGKNIFINSSRNLNISSQNKIYVSKKVSSNGMDYLKSIFDPIPFKFYHEFKEGFHVFFDSDNYYKALVRNNCLKINRSFACSEPYKLVLNNKERVLLPFIFRLETDCTDSSMLKLPFPHKFITLGNKDELNIKVLYEDFQKYIATEQYINNNRIVFKPIYRKIKMEKTNIHSKYEKHLILKKVLLFENISCRQDEEGHRIYPELKNLNDLRLFMFIFGKFNFQITLDINFGKEILDL